MIKENVKNYKVIPIGKRVLIKPVEVVAETSSGIILPDSQVQQKPQGTIVARGPEVDKELQIGDFVQWLINMTVDDKEFIHEGERHILLFQDAIICKLKELDV
jgi:chaperonin GroES